MDPKINFFSNTPSSKSIFSNCLQLTAPFPSEGVKDPRGVIQVQTHLRGGRPRQREEAAACCRPADRQTDRDESQKRVISHTSLFHSLQYL